MIKFLRAIFPDGDIPRDIKLLTWATTIRWVGWGFVESLIPIFLFSFAHSYAETGLLRSIYDIAFILAIPLVGLLIDKISARTVLIIGLCMYPFIGFSYFWAGVTGMSLFIVIGRLLNGIGYAFDNVGRSTYFRRHAPSKIISTVFGYFDTVTTFFWVVCVVSSVVLIQYFQINQLFLAIVPTSIIAIVMVLYLKKENKSEDFKDGVKDVLKEGVFSSLWIEIKGWHRDLRLISLANMYFGFIGIITSFIIPLDIYVQGGSLKQVILVAAAVALPSIFSIHLGKIADRWRIGSTLVGMFGMFVFLICLAFSSQYVLQMLFAFCFSLSLNQVLYAFDGITTDSIDSKHYGKMSGLLSDVYSVGELFGPIVLGLLVDLYSSRFTLLLVAGMTLVLFLIFFSQKSRFKYNYKIQEITI